MSEIQTLLFRAWRVILYSHDKCCEIERNIFFIKQNYGTSSFEFMNVFISACTIVGSLLDNDKFKNIFVEYYANFKNTKLTEIEIKYSHSNIELKPLLDDGFVKGGNGIKACAWWKAYNEIKHAFSYQKDSTLQNTLKAVYASFLFILYSLIVSTECSYYYLHPNRIIEFFNSETLFNGGISIAIPQNI